MTRGLKKFGHPQRFQAVCKAMEEVSGHLLQLNDIVRLGRSVGGFLQNLHSAQRPCFQQATALGKHAYGELVRGKVGKGKAWEGQGDGARMH